MSIFHPVLSVRTASSILLAVGFLFVGAITDTAFAQAPSPGSVHARLDSLRSSGSDRIGEATVVWTPLLDEFYARRLYAPVWNPERARELSRSIGDIALDGLDPADYHQNALARVVENRAPGSEGGSERPDTRIGAVDLEILRTDALLRLVHDLGKGKLDPENPGAGRAISPTDRRSVLEELERVVHSDDPRAALRSLRPDHFIYRGLIRSLAEYRRLESLGPWESIPSGPLIRAGAEDPRVVAIRDRLALLGDLPRDTPAGPTSSLVDDAFVAGVKTFQRRHGLTADGVVGPATLAELNVTPTRRIAQIRVNLERARWYTKELPDTFVAVNIAGAMAYLVRDGSVAWESRAIVGRTTTSTPIFRATMTYIDLNPTWTVPRSIAGEVLADIRRDPNYMARTGMRVIDTAGRPITVERDRLLSYGAGNFPWYFRQDPGPTNPLGRIKLMFPNRYNVYLHDTPARALFDSEERTFSHGCVRLQDPVGLAVEVLNDRENWDRTDIQEAIDAGGETRTIPLSTPIEVLILYWTAATDESGEPRFHRDVYGRDDAVLRGLDADG